MMREQLEIGGHGNVGLISSRSAFGSLLSLSSLAWLPLPAKAREGMLNPQRCLFS